MKLPSGDSGLLQTKAYEYLKNKILNNELEADKLYSETKIAAEIGISRTPLRQSLHRLSQDGYIVIYPSRGFMLRTLTPKDMKETIEMRCALEGFCTYQIGQEKDPQRKKQVLDTLRVEVKGMEEAKDLDQFIVHDHAFHMIIINYLGNQEFEETFQRLLYLIHLTTSNSLAVPGRKVTTLAEHKEYLQALDKDRVGEAYDILMSHLTMPLSLLYTDLA